MFCPQPVTAYMYCQKFTKWWQQTGDTLQRASHLHEVKSTQFEYTERQFEERISKKNSIAVAYLGPYGARRD